MKQLSGPEKLTKLSRNGPLGPVSRTVHLRCLSLMFSTTLCIVYTSIVLKQNRKNNKIQKYQCKTVDKN